MLISHNKYIEHIFLKLHYLHVIRPTKKHIYRLMSCVYELQGFKALPLQIKYRAYVIGLCKVALIRFHLAPGTLLSSFYFHHARRPT